MNYTKNAIQMAFSILMTFAIVGAFLHCTEKKSGVFYNLTCEQMDALGMVSDGLEEFRNQKHIERNYGEHCRSEGWVWSWHQ